MNKKLSRRDFLRLSALAAAGVALGRMRHAETHYYTNGHC
jgi:hypothetical protein